MLIINPHSGSGKAEKIGLEAKAKGLGIETVVRKKGEKLGGLANTAVDDGCDHLINAGGDGSLVLAAAFGCEEYRIDVGRIGKHLFLNNVSLGIYADAIAETGYREHKAESMVEATKDHIVGFGMANSNAMASVLIWRAATYFPPVLIGIGTMVSWRRNRARAVREANA